MKKFLTIVIILCVSHVSIGAYSSEKHLVNASFEAGFSGWHTYAHAMGNSVEIVRDVSRSGSSSVKLTALTPELPAGRSTGLHSGWVPVSENTLVEASAWVRANSIIPCGSPPIDGCRNWYNFRITLTAFDANNQKVKPKGHWDLVSTGGDICGISDTSECGWARVRASLVTPPGTAKMRLEVKFTSSTGTAWVDDLELKSVISMPELSASAGEAPPVYPVPAYISFEGDLLASHEVTHAIVGHAQDSRLIGKLKALFPSITLEPIGFTGAKGRIVIGSPTDDQLEDIRKQHFSTREWAELGNEGYFISLAGNDNPRTIYIGSNTAQGAYYALQSLKQLAQDGIIEPVHLWDFPEVPRRGIAMGLHWFQEGGAGRVAMRRLAERKGNMVWNQGSYLGGKFSFAWREPFTPGELGVMKEYLELARQHFIDVHLSFGPRTRYASGGCAQVDRYPTPVFSSRKEVELLVEKIRALHALGFRNFGLNFDDLEHCGEDVLRHQADIDRFSGDIGSAHVYFSNQVFAELRKIDPDIGLMVIPLWYTSAGNYVGSTANHKRDYLTRMRELDPGIELHSVQVFDEDFNAFHAFTGRPTMLWSNYFSMEKDTDFTLPWVNQFTWDDARVTGFIFLPAPPDLPDRRREDEGMVSWNSALGFAWAPSRYDPVGAFAKSASAFQ